MVEILGTRGDRGDQGNGAVENSRVASDHRGMWIIAILWVLAAGLTMFFVRRNKERKAAQLQQEQARAQAQSLAAWHEEQARREAQRQEQAQNLADWQEKQASMQASAEEAERQRRQDRLDDLSRRFGAEAARRIIAQQVWQGETAEMLVESFGQPEETTEKVMKTRTRRVFKYNPVGRGYRLKITLESDLVVGWEGDVSSTGPLS